MCGGLIASSGMSTKNGPGSARAVPRCPTGASTTDLGRIMRDNPNFAAVGAMGIRVADWWHPDLGVTADEVADAYAAFAVKLLT